MLRILAVALFLLSSGTIRGEIIGVWNFNQAENSVVSNQVQSSKVHAHLMDFDEKVLQGVDVRAAQFSISRTMPKPIQQSVHIARSGWSAFEGIPDNGLASGVNTPVGKQALALYSAREGNWIHFPGLAEALVRRPGGSIRTFGIAAWLILQTTDQPPKYRINRGKENPLLRFGGTDFRVLTYPGYGRFNTEDVGNGLGGARSYKEKAAHREATAARWFHLVITANGEANRFRMFINNIEMEYAHASRTTDGYPWPQGGGFQINYKSSDHRFNSAVMGRWLGGYAANDTTMGIGSLVIVRDEYLDEKKRQLLYELGRRGIPFRGNWNQTVE